MGVAAGVTVGAVWAVVSEDIVMGIGIGAAMAVAMGLALGSTANRGGDE
jgi:hypothetical protein